MGRPADWGRTRGSPPSHSLTGSQTTTNVNHFMTPQPIIIIKYQVALLVPIVSGVGIATGTECT